MFTADGTVLATATGRFFRVTATGEFRAANVDGENIYVEEKNLPKFIQV
jgi:hypothetical protein